MAWVATKTVDVKRAGQWMRRKRRELGWDSYTDLEAEAGLGREAVLRWELGYNVPSLEGFVAWAKALNMTPGEALDSMLREAGLL